VSLTQSTFVRDIGDVMGRYALAAPEIGLRVSGLDINDKGSKAARALSALSRQGHPVWLDHFTGAISGLPSFDARQGGYVEVPGTYLKRIAASQDGRELITRLFNLWREANFHIIVTNASQEDTLTFVSKLGVTLVLAAA
jgi:EAL domain-containing protein (putative c-di-GMP-specific phosphodiesterase class I)